MILVIILTDRNPFWLMVQIIWMEKKKKTHQKPKTPKLFTAKIPAEFS